MICTRYLAQIPLLIFKIVSNFNKNFEISLVVFMPKVTTSHIAITYTNDTTDTETRVITNSSLEAFARELQSYDWRSVLLLYDSTKALVAFGNGFCNLYDKYFPLKIYKKGHIRNLRNLWISEGLKKIF